MTIEELEQYRGIVADINALEQEINALYDVRRSPTSDGMGHGSTPGDPTGRAAMRIIELREQLRAEQDRWSDAAMAIEQWLRGVEDSEIRSIIRWRYALGCSWKETAKHVYGAKGYADACRMRIKRFFR